MFNCSLWLIMFCAMLLYCYNFWRALAWFISMLCFKVLFRLSNTVQWLYHAWLVIVWYHVVFEDVYLVICFVMIIFNKYDIILCVIRDVMIMFTIAFIMASDPVYFWFYVCERVSVELRIVFTLFSQCRM